jgi:hypothetical protein
MLLMSCTFPEDTMKTPRSVAAFALFATTAACATERVAAPQRSAAPVAASTKVALLPLLYVVDGVRLGRDQVPAIEPNRVASVEVIKGRNALERFGADAAYGVVLITTKQ